MGDDRDVLKSLRGENSSRFVEAKMERIHQRSQHQAALTIPGYLFAHLLW